MAAAKAERYLTELTSLPTAAGREGRVIAWIERWARRRRNVTLKADRAGNLHVRRRGAASRSPIIFAAHMDHPAFVVTAQGDGRTVHAEFRGGVADAYFVDSPVRLHRARGESIRGVVRELRAPTPPELDQRVTIELEEPASAAPGDLVTWDVPPAVIRDGRLYAAACDDLAAVAAAIVAFEALLRRRKAGDVRLLFTRAEEVGFVGAQAACHSGDLPKAARIVALENSKAFAESPLGGGPIVRVGDRTSTFDPGLTYAVSQVAQAIARDDPDFRFQRRLMPGGTCEATAYQCLGYTATCICLPLGNYHNMNEATGRIDAETIDLADFHGLVRLLVGVADGLAAADGGLSLRRRLDDVLSKRRHLLEERA